MSLPPTPPGPDEPARDDQPDPWASPQPPYGQPGQPAYGAPYPQPWGQPAPAYPPGWGPQPLVMGYPQKPNGKATAALWTGIASLVLAFCCGLGVLGVVPIVLGVKARGEIRATGGRQEGDGMALAGIITGAVAVVLSLVLIVVIVAAIAGGDSTLSPGLDTRV